MTSVNYFHGYNLVSSHPCFLFFCLYYHQGCTLCHRPWVLNQRSKVYMTSNSLKLGLIIIIGKASLSEWSQFRSFYVPNTVGAAEVAKERYVPVFDSICSSQIVWIVQSPVSTPNFIPYLHVKLWLKHITYI